LPIEGFQIEDLRFQIEEPDVPLCSAGAAAPEKSSIVNLKSSIKKPLLRGAVQERGNEKDR
jgi:hypothetical protein